MADLPLDQAVARFNENEARINQFVNAPDDEDDYETSEGQRVPVLPKLLPVVNASVVRAEVAAVEAIAARDITFLDALIAADITAGLALTVDTGTENRYFRIFSGSAADSFVYYRHDPGAVASELKRYPSSEYVRGAKVEFLNASESLTLTYPNPGDLARVGYSGAGSLLLTADQEFSRGGFGVGVEVVNTTPIGADSLITVAGVEGVFTVVTHEFELTANNDTVSFPAFGLMMDVPDGEVCVMYRTDGLIFYSLPDLTVPSTGPLAAPYEAGDMVAIELTFGGAVVSARFAKNGVFGAPQLLELLPTTGNIKFAFRRMLQGITRVVKRQRRAGELDPLAIDSSLTQLEALSADATQVHQERWADLSELVSVNASGGDLPMISPAALFKGSASALSVDWATYLGTSNIGATHIGASGLRAGMVLRLSAKLTASNTTPALGIGFGNESTQAKGFALRTTGQLLTLTLTGNITGGASGPAPRAYAPGDTVVVDARLIGGTPGDYSVRYYVEYSDGARFGPYDVAGIPSVDSAWFMVRARSSWTDVKLSYHRPPLYVSEFVGGSSAAAPNPIVYVAPAPAGNDLNPGTKASPVATINKAWSLLPGAGVIELAGGEYRGLGMLTGITGDLTLRCEPYKRAMILGSSRLNLAKSAGYTQVYQAPLATKPVGMGAPRGPAMIFELGTPSKPILEAERHDLHRGATHRLPYTEMLEAASIGDLDTPAGRGKWFWVGGVIYLAATDGGDALAGRYEARTSSTLITNGASLDLRRIDTYFSLTVGLKSEGLGRLYREDCRSFGHYQDGWQDDANITIAVRDESGGVGNDGINGHARANSAATGNRDETYMAMYFEPWSHDNYDDGHSFHERGECSIHGGLFEYCKKAGVVQVSGASVVCHGTISRHSAHGFYAATTPLDSRQGAVLRCHGTIAENNDYNYRSASPGSKLLAFDCISGEANIMGYQADAEGSGGGQIVARNCRHGGDPAKAKAGNVLVINDAPLL